MEYFQIFTERMVYCRRAAEYLGYEYALRVNEVQLLYNLASQIIGKSVMSPVLFAFCAGWLGIGNTLSMAD